MQAGGVTSAFPSISDARIWATPVADAWSSIPAGEPVAAHVAADLAGAVQPLVPAALDLPEEHPAWNWCRTGAQLAFAITVVAVATLDAPALVLAGYAATAFALLGLVAVADRQRFRDVHEHAPVATAVSTPAVSHQAPASGWSTSGPWIGQPQPRTAPPPAPGALQALAGVAPAPTYVT